jgi:cyclopropane-fatty-acyl-phospholipid synthase
MFEHMKNWPLLFSRISSWLRHGGRFFMHVFTHRSHSYHFEVRDESDWMSRYFFTGGMMPSDDLATRFQEHLQLVKHWRVNGRHYHRTAECWLENMDAHRERIMPLFASCYGDANAERWWSYWRVFFMSCAELWGYRKGEEWLVSHYAFDKPVFN